MLASLLLGTPRQTIARELLVSVRTLESEITTLRRSLAATTLYTTGVLAIRHRHVRPTTIVSHIDQRIANRGWTPPTHRQSEIVRLLAAGWTYPEVAPRLGLSTTTVRRDIGRLSIDNGVDRLATAGALFEILGWHTG